MAERPIGGARELLLFLYAESPVHAGASDSLGVLDLPIQREATTGYPVIWGQSLKGAMRQAAVDRGYDAGVIQKVFGSAVVGPEAGREAPGRSFENSEAPRSEHMAGLLSVGDAQLVALPAPTLRRTFAWVTSQIALSRLARKYAIVARAGGPDVHVPEVAADGGAASSAIWIHQSDEVLGPCLVALGQQPNLQLTTWAERLAKQVFGVQPAPAFAPFAEKLRSDLLLVGSDLMPTITKECTEFTARVQLTDKKTVAYGPFHSEYLPTETILAAVLTLRSLPSQREPYQDGLDLLDFLLHGELLQVGGDETLGKGLMWARLLDANAIRASEPEVSSTTREA